MEVRPHGGVRLARRYRDATGPDRWILEAPAAKSRDLARSKPPSPITRITEVVVRHRLAAQRGLVTTRGELHVVVVALDNEETRVAVGALDDEASNRVEQPLYRAGRNDARRHRPARLVVSTLADLDLR